MDQICSGTGEVYAAPRITVEVTERPPDRPRPYNGSDTDAVDGYRMDLTTGVCPGDTESVHPHINAIGCSRAIV
ncbi:MAG: hypothetical protein E7L40_04825 [Corynebacterium kroppenstedtii]|nr:hypothetical protein [Corynebacterium kroppenstedtii]